MIAFDRLYNSLLLGGFALLLIVPTSIGSASSRRSITENGLIG